MCHVLAPASVNGPPSGRMPVGRLASNCVRPLRRGADDRGAAAPMVGGPCDGVDGRRRSGRGAGDGLVEHQAGDNGEDRQCVGAPAVGGRRTGPARSACATGVLVAVGSDPAGILGQRVALRAQRLAPLAAQHRRATFPATPRVVGHRPRMAQPRPHASSARPYRGADLPMPGAGAELVVMSCGRFASRTSTDRHECRRGLDERARQCSRTAERQAGQWRPDDRPGTPTARQPPAPATNAAASCWCRQ